MKGRAQVSIEFLLIIGFAMLLSFPLMYIFLRQTETMSTEISGTQIDKVASEIRDAADEVYYLGPPSRKSLLIYMPDEVKTITFYGSSIIFNVSSPNGEYEIVKWSVANFSTLSSISPSPGLKRIFTEAQSYEVLVNDSS